MDINPDSLETIEITLPHQGPPILDPVREEWWRGKLRYEIDRREEKHQIEMAILRSENAELVNRMATLNKLMKTWAFGRGD